jgi:hypothetical protein
MGVVDSILSFLLGIYNYLLGVLPEGMHSSLLVLVFAILIALVAIFIWYFYKSLSRRSLMSLNLNRYNRSEHPFFSKLIVAIFYVLENIIIMPFLIFVWFAALSIVILVIVEEQTAGGILMLTAAMVISIRILSYYKQEIAQDLAKMFPFITLSVFLLSPGALSFQSVLDRIGELPSLFGDVLSFLVLVFIVEIVLRIGYTLQVFLKSEETPALPVRK